ncbi:MAG: VOC family protein [Ktedonobacterales bacterium]
MPSASQSACLRIGNHRAQLVFGDGAVILTERHTIQRSTTPDEVSHTVHVRVEGVDQHYAHTEEHGARIVHPPADYPYGERQYTADDIGSHRWTFSQSIADVAPEAWGAILGKLE